MAQTTAETKECVNSLGRKEASLGIPLREYSGEEEEGGGKFNVFKGEDV